MTSENITLLGFNSIDIRNVQINDVVRFRSTSITHSQQLPLMHGRTARVVGFSKNRAGQNTINVRFARDLQLHGEPTADELKADPTLDKLTPAIGLAPINLIANTAETAEAAVSVRKTVSELVAHSNEQRRPWMARLHLQAMLGDAGMYDRLGTPATQPQADSLDDLPY